MSWQQAIEDLDNGRADYVEGSSWDYGRDRLVITRGVFGYNMRVEFDGKTREKVFFSKVDALDYIRRRLWLYE
jgi:hypothetical protein